MGSAFLTGCVALVTGGGRGLGPVMARALAGSGAAVAVGARTLRELEGVVSTIEDTGATAMAVPFDVSSRIEVEEAIARVESTLGPIDVLVNNAGRFHAVGPLVDVDADDWWRELEVNLRGPMLCAAAVLGSMVARRGGRIVNVVSGAATVPLAGASAYSASKTALLRLTETLAVELAGTGVHVFAVDPGVLRTPMNEELLRTRLGVLQRWAPWFPALFAEGHEDPPDAVAQLVVALAEGRADPLSGRFLSVHSDLGGQVTRSEEIGRDELLTLRIRTTS